MAETRSDAFDAAVETLAARLPERERLLLCLEFDAALAPAVDGPDASILPEARAALAELHGHPDVAVAVVSGRALSDVRTRVDLPGVVYAGNHGLELRTEGVTKVHPVAETYRGDVERVRARLGDAFDGDPDVTVEDRGQTLSVRHRDASDRRVRTVRTTVARVVGECASGTLAVRGEGDALAVRPAVDWDTGSVVSSLQRERAASLPVFVGDARTDEAGFRAVERDGVGVGVGDPDERATAATEFVRGPDGAAALLEWLRRAGVERLGDPPETVRPDPSAGRTGDRSTKSD